MMLDLDRLGFGILLRTWGLAILSALTLQSVPEIRGKRIEFQQDLDHPFPFACI